MRTALFGMTGGLLAGIALGCGAAAAEEVLPWANAPKTPVAAAPASGQDQAAVEAAAAQCAGLFEASCRDLKTCAWIAEVALPDGTTSPARCLARPPAPPKSAAKKSTKPKEAAKKDAPAPAVKDAVIRSDDGVTPKAVKANETPKPPKDAGLPKAPEQAASEPSAKKEDAPKPVLTEPDRAAEEAKKPAAAEAPAQKLAAPTAKADTGTTGSGKVEGRLPAETSAASTDPKDAPATQEAGTKDADAPKSPIVVTPPAAKPEEKKAAKKEAPKDPQSHGSFGNFSAAMSNDGAVVVTVPPKQ